MNCGTDGIVIPATQFDVTLRIKLRKNLNNDELTTYLERYKHWMTGQCQRDWFQHESHYIRLFTDNTPGKIQYLIYHGYGGKHVDMKVAKDFVHSRQYKIKMNLSISIMSTRMYMFSRIMMLPICTRIVSKIDGSRTFEAIGDCVHPLSHHPIRNNTNVYHKMDTPCDDDVKFDPKYYDVHI